MPDNDGPGRWKTLMLCMLQLLRSAPNLDIKARRVFQLTKRSNICNRPLSRSRYHILSSWRLCGAWKFSILRSEDRLVAWILIPIIWQCILLCLINKTGSLNLTHIKDSNQKWAIKFHWLKKGMAQRFTCKEGSTAPTALPQNIQPKTRALLWAPHVSQQTKSLQLQSLMNVKISKQKFRQAWTSGKRWHLKMKLNLCYPDPSHVIWSPLQPVFLHQSPTSLQNTLHGHPVALHV